MDSLYERYAAQLTRMASMPGSREYARERAQELEREDQYGWYRGIYQAVNDQIKAGLDKPTESASLSPEKSP